jgi:hypothetical protein
VRTRPLASLAVAALVLAATFGISASARAATPTALYVDNLSGASCSDAGSGTQSQPFCTISAAGAVALPGQTISVYPASYPEHVTITKSGLPGQPITLVSAAGQANLTGANAGLSIDGQHDIVINNLSIVANAGTAAVDLANSSRITLNTVMATCPASPASLGMRLRSVADSVLNNTAACAYSLDAATSGVVISKANVYRYRTGPGIDVAGSNNTVVDSYFQPVSNVTSIVLEPGATDNVIADNTAGESRAVAIDNNGASGTAITNNTVAVSCGTGIRIAGASAGVHVENTLITESATDNCTASSTGVDIGVYDDAVASAVVDYNTLAALPANRYPYAWQTPTNAMTLEQFRAASGQAAHDTGDGQGKEDSANADAPGFQHTDRYGSIPEDNPAVPNTGAGPVTFADRGATENVQGPVASLAAIPDPTSTTMILDASRSTPGWVPITKYHFDFGDGASVDQTTPIAAHKILRSGSTVVSVQVYDASGVVATASVGLNLWNTIGFTALMALADDRWVTGGSTGSAPLIANGLVAGMPGKFNIVQWTGDFVALQSWANARYVKVNPDSTLSATIDDFNSASVFTIVHNSDGTVSLSHNGLYVSAEAAGTKPLVANRTAIGPWEKFYATDPGRTSLALTAKANNRFVTAESAGKQPLIANRTAVGSWEFFDLVDVGGGNVAVFSHADGKFVTAESAGAKPLIANRTAVGAWERFQVVNNSNGTISLIATINRRYVTAEAGGTQPLIANRTAIGTWETFAVTSY